MISGKERMWWDMMVSWMGNVSVVGGVKLIVVILIYFYEVSFVIVYFFLGGFLNVDEMVIGCLDKILLSVYGGW